MRHAHPTIRRVVATGLCGLLLASGTPVVARADSTIEARYEVRLAGLSVGKLFLNGTVGTTGYVLSGWGKISGLPQLFIDFKGQTQSSGRRIGDRISPADHSISYNTVKKIYSAEMAFSDRAVKEIALDPPYREKPSRVPLADDHRVGVIDPLSAIILPVAGDDDVLSPSACDRTVPIFDGRERFDVELSFKDFKRVRGKRTGEFDGVVVRCYATYKPIAGHRRNDPYMKRLSEPGAIEVWLAPIPNERALVFYRAKVPTPLGQAVIRPKSFRL